MSQTALLSQMESRIVCEADVSPVVSSEILCLEDSSPDSFQLSLDPSIGSYISI